ncbi:MAG TPA: ATP-binding cassette domain-containing protein [Flavobacterium sp.]|jgi:putative ABC transport system ATP-binding protein|nr:ATP-binding cassette domain-containing protein [Flavobacterium sp.]
MVQSEKLAFSYNKTTTFDFPDINCQAAETLLITGGSGRGKTTLLHLLGGLLRPHSGRIAIDSVDLNTLSERQLDQYRGQNIGIILQESHFVESLSVVDNVALASWLATGKKKIEKARTILEQLGLSDQAHKQPSKLSIGQQQRVSIARALINEPRLLLADEPTSSLDDANAASVAELLSGLATDFRAALIIVTHDQRLKDRFSNSITL